MTIIILSIIWSICFIFCVIRFFVEKNKLIKYLSKPEYAIVKEVFNELKKMPILEKPLKKCFNPRLYLIYSIMVFGAAPLLVLEITWRWINKKYNINRKMYKESQEKKRLANIARDLRIQEEIANQPTIKEPTAEETDYIFETSRGRSYPSDGYVDTEEKQEEEEKKDVIESTESIDGKKTIAEPDDVNSEQKKFNDIAWSRCNKCIQAFENVSDENLELWITAIQHITSKMSPEQVDNTIKELELIPVLKQRSSELEIALDKIIKLDVYSTLNDARAIAKEVLDKI